MDANKIAYAKSIIEKDPQQFMEGKDIGLWHKVAREQRDLGPDYDYSMAAALDSRGHAGDVGKLPNHITFGGHWNGNVFTPAPWHMDDHSARIRQWLVDNNHTDGDIYLGADGKPLQSNIK